MILLFDRPLILTLTQTHTHTLTHTCALFPLPLPHLQKQAREEQSSLAAKYAREHGNVLPDGQRLLDAEVVDAATVQFLKFEKQLKEKRKRQEDEEKEGKVSTHGER